MAREIDWHIVIRRDADQLNCETKYYGPYPSYGAAYDTLCALVPVKEGGVKFVQALSYPDED